MFDLLMGMVDVKNDKTGVTCRAKNMNIYFFIFRKNLFFFYIST